MGQVYSADNLGVKFIDSKAYYLLTRSTGQKVLLTKPLTGPVMYPPYVAATSTVKNDGLVAGAGAGATPEGQRNYDCGTGQAGDTVLLPDNLAAILVSLGYGTNV